jgi:hypothetical protein
MVGVDRFNVFLSKIYLILNNTSLYIKQCIDIYNTTEMNCKDMVARILFYIKF